jgi:hypothetical protein
MTAALLRIRHSVALLTEKRAVLFVVLDALFLFAGLLAGLNGNGSGAELWLPFFVFPALVVGVPMLSDSVAVERRSGTLDLALTSPGARFYFERRVAAVSALVVAQGWITMLLTRVLMDRFPLSGPLLQVISVALFLGAATLHWAVRLRTAGAVTFATYLTVAAFGPWLFANPIHPPESMDGPMTGPQMFASLQNNLVLLAAAAVFYAYARERLLRPERIIT